MPINLAAHDCTDLAAHTFSHKQRKCVQRSVQLVHLRFLDGYEQDGVQQVLLQLWHEEAQVQIDDAPLTRVMQVIQDILAAAVRADVCAHGGWYDTRLQKFDRKLCGTKLIDYLSTVKYMRYLSTHQQY